MRLARNFAIGLLLVAGLEGSLFALVAVARTPTQLGRCPRPAEIVYPTNPSVLHGPALHYARTHYGHHTVIQTVQRATHRDYGNLVFTLCGSTVGRDSVLAVVHPTGGGPCSACNSALYFVKLRHGGWHAWVRFD